MNTRLGEQLITVAEAAHFLQISQSTIWRWIDSGKLPAYRIGQRRIRLKREDLEPMVTPARGDKGGAIGKFERPQQRRLSAEEQEKALAAFEKLQRLRDKIVARRGGKLFSPSSDILDALRDERSRQLS